jgi:hypothetical protein
MKEARPEDAAVSHRSADEIERLDAELRRLDAIALSALAARLRTEKRLQQLLNDVDLASDDPDRPCDSN